MRLKQINSILLFLGLFVFSSCIEIIDDLTLHPNGSGEWKIKINLSESTIKINSVLALDSINGYKVPTKAELSNKALSFKNTLQKQTGISQVTLEEDLTHYIWTVSIHFNTLKNLELAVFNALKMQGIKGVKLPENGFVRKNNKNVVKQFPFDLSQLSAKLKAEDRTKLFQGKYISILRFDDIILKNSNLHYAISKNRKATMAQYSLKECLQNASIINNNTTLK